MRPTKEELYIRMAYLVAERSTCARRRVGCVLVDEQGIILATGYNGVAAGRPHCNEGHECKGATMPSGKGLDQCQALHAEQNAIIHLREPQNVHTAYVTDSPCISCIKLLLGTSCRRLVFSRRYPHPEAQDWWEKAGREWVHSRTSVLTRGTSGQLIKPEPDKDVKICEYCDRPFRVGDGYGRTDKRFCKEGCRTMYHRAKKLGKTL